MNIKFHFFCEYEKVPNVNVFYDYFTKDYITEETEPEKVYFRFNDPSIENKADFMLCKLSEVPNIVNLSRNYKDLKFCVEFPLALSSFHYTQIFKVIEGLNNLYPIYYYCEEIVSEILPFNLDEIVRKLIRHRDAFVRTEELGSVNKKYYIDRDLLTYVNEYQKRRQYIIDLVKDVHKQRINVNPFIALHKIKHNEGHHINFAIDLNLEYLTIIPDHVDYFYVPTPDGDGNCLVKASVVLKDIEQFLTPYKDEENFVPGTRIVDFDQIAKAKKKFEKKLKKYYKKASDKNDFDPVSQYSLLDR